MAEFVLLFKIDQMTVKWYASKF